MECEELSTRFYLSGSIAVEFSHTDFVSPSTSPCLQTKLTPLYPAYLALLSAKQPPL